MSKVYPNRTVEEAARAAGAQVVCLWQMKGPPHTLIEWMEGLLINGTVCLIQTFREGGWQAYTPCQSNRTDDTLADVLNRCGVPAPAGEAEG